MKTFNILMTWQGKHVNQFLNRHFYQIDVNPEPGYSFGRKGKVLVDTWNQVNNSVYDGILLMEGDVLIDPSDFKAMTDAISTDVNAVWVAPVKIWPASSGRNDWHWGHWMLEPSQVNDLSPLWFSFNFTFLPERLIELAIKEGWENWTYPDGEDMKVSEVARKNQIKAKVVKECLPKHLHY